MCSPSGHGSSLQRSFSIKTGWTHSYSSSASHTHTLSVPCTDTNGMPTFSPWHLADCGLIVLANISKSTFKSPKKNLPSPFQNLYTHTSTPRPSVQTHKVRHMTNKPRASVWQLSKSLSNVCLNACNSFIQQFCTLWDLHANERLRSWATEHDCP